MIQIPWSQYYLFKYLHMLTSCRNLLDGTCPSIDNLPDLWGALPQATLLIQNLQERDVEEAHKEITIGGSWAPKDCKVRTSEK